MFKIVSLFSGAGGLDLGFEKAGFLLFGQMSLIRKFGILLNIIFLNVDWIDEIL